MNKEENNISRYREFLKSLYNLKNDCSVSFQEIPLKPMAKDEIKAAAENFHSINPYHMLCLIVDNKDYGKNEFSLEDELKNLNMADEFNPISMWYQTMSDLSKQWGFKNIPAIDPTTVYINNGIEDTWMENHKKMFPYQLISRLYLSNNPVNDSKYAAYKISGETINDILDSYDKEHIYCVIQ